MMACWQKNTSLFHIAIIAIACFVSFEASLQAQQSRYDMVPKANLPRNNSGQNNPTVTNQVPGNNQTRPSNTQSPKQGYYQNTRNAQNGTNPNRAAANGNPNRTNNQTTRQPQPNTQKTPVRTPQGQTTQGRTIVPIRKVNRTLPKPFQLTKAEQVYLDQLLTAWEKRSDKINKFECKFKRWQYDKDFGAKDNKGQDIAISISEGDIKYYNPDKGLFKVKKSYIWNRQTTSYQEKPNPVDEHWITNGMSVFEFNGLTKQIVERRLPPQLQGKAIIDGPLPFLFGANADKLKKRFYMRERTDPRYQKEEVWLEAYPRTQRDFANFRRVQLIMKRKNFIPYAMRMYLPDGRKYTVYEFNKPVINSIFLSKKTFQKPSTPRGWKLVVENPPINSRAKTQSPNTTRRK